MAIEAINQTFTTLLRTLASKTLKDWHMKMAYAKLAYNRAPSFTTLHSPFECVHGVNLLTMYEQIKGHIEKEHTAYESGANKHRKNKEFKPTI